MSHFAKVHNGIVVQVISAEPEFFDSFVDDSPGQWIQTSYNTRKNQHPENRPLRGNFAGIGYVYDETNDVFYEAQPYPSWTLDTNTWTWQPPVPYPNPNDAEYEWNESTQTWDIVTESE